MARFTPWFCGYPFFVKPNITEYQLFPTYYCTVKVSALKAVSMLIVIVIHSSFPERENGIAEKARLAFTKRNNLSVKSMC